MGAVEVSLYYDGSSLTLYGPRHQYFATTAAPDTLDETIDFARARLHMEAPGADLLYSNVYDVLTEDVITGRYVGMETVDGELVHHLAFEGNQTDWQIWIEDGDAPLPRRLVITSKDVLSFPQFTVTLRDWNVNPRLREETFTFQPGPGAREIDFEAVWQRVEEERERLRNRVNQNGGGR